MKRHAFTMIEIIFIVVILGILAAIVIPKMAASREDAKIATLKHDIATLTQAIPAMGINMNTDSSEILFEAANLVGLNWKFDMLDEAGDDVAMHSTLAGDGGVAKKPSDSCAVLWLRYDPKDEQIPNNPKPLVERDYGLMVYIKDTPLCRKLKLPKETFIPFYRPNGMVKF